MYLTNNNMAPKSIERLGNAIVHFIASPFRAPERLIMGTGPVKGIAEDTRGLLGAMLRFPVDATGEAAKGGVKFLWKVLYNSPLLPFASLRKSKETEVAKVQGDTRGQLDDLRAQIGPVDQALNA